MSRRHMSWVVLVLSWTVWSTGCGDDPAGPSGPSLGGDAVDADAGSDDAEGGESPAPDDTEGTDTPDPEGGDDAGDTGEEGGDADAETEGGDADAATEGGDAGDADVTGGSCSDQPDSDGWCEATMDLGPCERASCNDLGECVSELETSLDCCLVDSDCDDGNLVTFDYCPSEGLACENPADPTQCADKKLYLDSNFDDGSMQGWTVEDGDGKDVVGWRVSTFRSHQGDYSFYFGREDCENYYTNALNPDCSPVGGEAQGSSQSGAMISPELTLEPNTAIAATFFVYADLELFADPSLPPCTPELVADIIDDLSTACSETVGGESVCELCWDPVLEELLSDTLGVYVSYVDDEGEAQEDRLWTIVELVEPTDVYAKGTDGAFLQIGADLTPWAGKAVRIRVDVTSNEFDNLAFEGVFMDTVVVRSSCAEVFCTDDTQCASPDTCKSNACTPLVNSETGFCFAIADSNCTSCPDGDDANCGDNDDCTHDTCGAGNTCTYAAVPECCEPDTTGGPFGFDDGALPPGWKVSGGSGDVGWSVAPSSDGEGFELYFGDPATGNYDAGEQAFGTVTTGFFNLPLSAYALLGTMELKLATEWQAGGFDPAVHSAFPADALTIHVLHNEDGVEVETIVFDALNDIGGATGDKEEFGTADYENIGFDLTAWQGRSIRLRFTFDSLDAASNEHEGVFIDNLALVEICDDPGCTFDESCEDDLPCTVDSCVAGFCTNVVVDPFCCTSNEECDDGNPCTDDECVEALGCINTYKAEEACCYESSVGVSDFEGSAFGWEFTAAIGDVGWSFQNGPNAFDGGGFLYFGNPDTGTYDETDTVVEGAATSPAFSLSPGGTTALSFQLNLSTEFDSVELGGVTDFPPPFPLDQLRVIVRDTVSFGEIEVWNSDQIKGTTAGEYQKVEVSLAIWAGQEVQIIFDFNSGDPTFNGYGGVRVDNLGVVVLCTEVECFSSADCEDEDGNICTAPDCSSNQCVEEPFINLPVCCSEHDVLAVGFDSGSEEGFDVTALSCGENTALEECIVNDNAKVKWQVSDLKAQDGNYSLYFGNAETGLYDEPGLAVSGYAESGIISIFSGLTASLSMWVYVDVEKFDLDNPSSGLLDRFEIIVTEILPGNPPGEFDWIVFSKILLTDAEYGTWVEVDVPLDEYAGSDIKVKVLFDSEDQIDNAVGMGVFVDGVTVTQGCDTL